MRTILPATWALAERLYFEGEFSIAEIAERCKMNRNTLYARAKNHNWPLHPSIRLEGAVSERAVMRRIIMAKLNQLETRMEDPAAKPADDERSARAMASLLTTVDKLDAKDSAWREKIIQSPADDPSSADANAQTHGADNVDQWRRELVRRIASLGEKWKQ